MAPAGALDVVPLIVERLDLALRQRDDFRTGPQALFAFLGTAAFAECGTELGGYDVSDAGAVRLVN